MTRQLIKNIIMLFHSYGSQAVYNIENSLHVCISCPYSSYFFYLYIYSVQQL